MATVLLGGWLLENESPEAVIHAGVAGKLTSSSPGRQTKGCESAAGDKTGSYHQEGDTGIWVPKAGDLMIVKDHSWFGQQG